MENSQTRNLLVKRLFSVSLWLNTNLSSEFEQRHGVASWRHVVVSRGVVWCRVVSSRRGHALWLPEVLTAPRAVVAWSRGVVVSRGGFLTAS